MFITLPSAPKNPRHFIALCFLKSKDDPMLKENNRLLKKVFEVSNVAVFNCAYGFFIVNKNEQYSRSFFSEFNDVKSILKSAHLIR